jgi:hypothetical protein
MDERRFDALTRALASSKTRRGYLVGALAFLGASALAVRGGTTETAEASCREEDDSCTLTSSCCSGLTCVRTSLFNPNVGVCQPGGDPDPNPTRSPFRPTATPTSTPTMTPTPTPVPGRVIRVPMTVTVDCDTIGEQSITFVGRFGRRRRLPIDVVQIRSFLNQGVGYPQPGPRLTRSDPVARWRWLCSAAIPNTVCKSREGRFFMNDLGTDGVAMHIRYERIDCDARVSCAEGSNPDGFLRCVSRV